MIKIKRAVLSVYDKTGLIEFAKFLREYDITLISTGGTGSALHGADVDYLDVSEVTGFPEIMDGRVKTLHPKLHGGILARRDLESHKSQMKEFDIEPIDLVVVNLYPFEKIVSERPLVLADAIENIDIGGPAMIRAAAKNYKDILVLISPSQYKEAIQQIKNNSGSTKLEYRFQKAKEAFVRTTEYDRYIADFLSGVEDAEPSVVIDGPEEAFPQLFSWSGSRVLQMRYGENPHQGAALYLEKDYEGSTLANAEQLQGKALSFNNIIDFESAWFLSNEFDMPASAIIKHTNPCGVATSTTLLEAYEKARDTDPTSAFGSVIGFNKKVDAEVAEAVISTFVEGVVASGFAPESLELFKKKKNIRVLKLPKPKIDSHVYDFKRITGGLLVQSFNDKLLPDDEIKTVTKRKPTAEERKALIFAWTVAKYVKSNAIVYAREEQTVGIGAGQMSRVDSAKIGVMKAQLPVEGSVLASDAFFPFRDGVDAAAEAGVTAIIQPGGSIRDKEVIEAADEHGIAMLFTGMRHFRH